MLTMSGSLEEGEPVGAAWMAWTSDIDGRRYERVQLKLGPLLVTVAPAQAEQLRDALTTALLDAGGEG